MRMRRWFIALVIVVGGCMLLFGVDYFLKARGMSFTLHIGKKLDQMEFVPVNLPVDIDVDCNVTSVLKGNNCIACDYDSKITFRNKISKVAKFHLPLLRKSHAFPGSTQYVYTADLEPEFKQDKTVTLKEGESYTITFAKKSCDFSDRDLFDGKEKFDYGRWALVFGVPEGENPDEYIVGTVLTNPIHWTIDKNCKDYGKE